MRPYLALLTLFFFSVRTLLIKTQADIVFFFATILLLLLETFGEDSRVCRFFSSACCVCMSVFCLALSTFNTFFDATFLTTFVIWLVLLISPILDNNPCLPRKKTV